MVAARVFLLFLAIPVPLALTFAAAGHESARNLVALSAGTVAFTMMALNQALATRPPILERLLGGLDRAYALHKWLGAGVLGLVLVHTQVRFQQLGGVVPPGSLAETAVAVAKPAFYVLLALLLVSLFKRIPGLRFELPYGLWRQSHRLMGLVFLALVFHQFFVKAPFRSFDPIRLWLIAMSLLGVASFLYTLLGAPLRRRRYTVASVQHHPAATIIEASPVRRGLRPRAGSFAFLSVGRDGLREPHPFTLSRIGPDGAVQVAVRPLGDFTRRLRSRIQPGDRLWLEGGYGAFDPLRAGGKQVWIAGGIGITPFLALAEALNPRAHPDIVLFHSVATPDEAVGQDRLRAVAEHVDGFHVFLHATRDRGRLTARTVLESLPFRLSEAELWFCGPAPMRKSLMAQFAKTGDRPARVHFERFEFR